MKEKELTKKELLAQEVGMKFDEVAPIFSEETLSTMTMAHVVGGTDDTKGNCVEGCNGTINTYCSSCTINEKDCDDKSKEGNECGTKIALVCGNGNTTKGGVTCGGTGTTKPTEAPTNPTV